MPYISNTTTSFNGMKTIHDWLSAYGVSHQNPLNKMIHFVCVPLIFFSIEGLLYCIQPFSSMPYINLAFFALLFVLFFYARLSFAITIGAALFSALCFFICSILDASGEHVLLKTSIVIFVVAWIFQFYGHKVEGAKPSFIDDLKFLLIGPAWIISFIYKKLGIAY